MIGCKTRGFSFTRALLGISADEVHLCGDPAAVPLVQEILKSTDDDVLVIEILTIVRLQSVTLFSFQTSEVGVTCFLVSECALQKKSGPFHLYPNFSLSLAFFLEIIIETLIYIPLLFDSGVGSII